MGTSACGRSNQFVVVFMATHTIHIPPGAESVLSRALDRSSRTRRRRQPLDAIAADW